MKIYSEELSDVNRYIQKNQDLTIEDREVVFESIIRMIKKFIDINEGTKLLEIGTGTGWFPILCQMKGISCKGIEISPQLIQFGKEFGQRYGIQPDLELGNIEETDIGESKYDAIIASSIFEHVEYWKEGVRRVFKALKPGGLLYFVSTNKFSLISGEYKVPLYGWLPNKWRYRLRTVLQDEDIMKLGIDYNQFTYFQLRRFFKQIGFSIVMDVVEVIDPDNLFHPNTYKRIGLKIVKRSRFIKTVALFFAPVTFFICIKSDSV